MNLLHGLDVWSVGGIQEYVLLIQRYSRHHSDCWGVPSTMAPYLEAEGCVIWPGGPPQELQDNHYYSVFIGHGVAGWSWNDGFRWAKERGMRTVECVHSNARVLTDPSLVDAFVSLNHIADVLNSHMPNRRVIYGVVEVDKFNRKGLHNKIGRLSRLASEKRPQDFVELARQFPYEQFVLAGDGVLYNQLFSSAPANCALPGMLRDFPEFYAQLKLFVFPTQDEACCVSVAMAQAAGIPVICSDIPPLRETTGGFATFCRSPSEFRSAVANYLEAPIPHVELAEQGRAWVRSHFAPEVTVGAWDALVESLV